MQVDSVRRIIFFIITVSVMVGCVSKKKYLAMESLKESYLKESQELKTQNDKLQQDIKNGEIDFNQMRTALNKSDAMKNDLIDKIKSEYNAFKERFNTLETELSKTKEVAKDQEYYSTKIGSDIARLEMMVRQLERDTANLGFALKLAEVKNVNFKIQSDQYLAQLSEKEKESADNLSKQKNAEAEVSRLKKQIKEVNDAFIALRKEMLMSFSKSAPFDPNSSPNADKVSRALGQY